MKNIYVVGPKDKVPGGSDTFLFNTTSKVKSIFSPFYNATTYPVAARKMENAWQFSKVYAQHDNNGQPSEDWYEWRDRGFAAKWAERYPMGKGAVPEYVWFDNQRLGYIESRKQLYIPLYRNIITQKHVDEINIILSILRFDDIALWDYDGYLTADDFDTIVNNPNKKMGHAFVLREIIKEHAIQWEKLYA